MKIKLPKLELKGFRHRRHLTIIEIGNDWLKLAEGAGSSAGTRIEKADFKKLADIEGPIEATIRDIVKRLRLNRRLAIACIPRHLVTVRILELPSSDSKEISNMVDLQIGKQTPYSKEEISCSYRIIDTTKEGYTKIMLVIAHHTVICERLETLRKADIEVEKVALSTEGVFNWFSAAYQQELKSEAQEHAVVLLDIDSSFSEFIVIRKAKFAFTRNILIGANQLTENPAEWQGKFIDELKHSMELYQNEARECCISTVFLSGASKSVKNLDEILSSSLGVASNFVEPLRGVSTGRDASALCDDRFNRVSKSAILGIAMAAKDLKLDMTPGDVSLEKMMQGKRKNLMFMGVLLASIITMSSILFLAYIHNKNSYLAQLKNRIVQIEKEAGDVENMSTVLRMVERRLDARGSSLDLLAEISSLIPKEIFMTYIHIEERNRIVLKGRAVAMSDVFRFITTLERSPILANAKTTQTTTKREQDAEYAEFEIICFYAGEGLL